MREMRREPEVAEEKSPSGRMSRWLCKHHLKGTCTNSFCEKWHTLECLFYKSENGCRFGEKCSYAHRQVDEQPSKRSEKNGDKSAVVAMLKKHESYDGTERPVVCRDTSHERHGLVVCNSANTRQMGCVFQDMEPPKSSSILRKSSRHAETDPTCKIQRSCCTSRIHPRPKSFARTDLPQVNLISVAPALQNLRTGLRRR